jgi:hypothetical protein
MTLNKLVFDQEIHSIFLSLYNLDTYQEQSDLFLLMQKHRGQSLEDIDEGEGEGVFNGHSLIEIEDMVEDNISRLRQIEQSYTPEEKL